MSTAAPTPDADQLALLADAISDVGYWTWWAQKLPDTFQVEFAAAQLYFAPPASPDQPPPSLVALQFQQPTCVCFLYRGQEETDFTWVEQLQQDELPSPICSHDEFGFGDDTLLRDLLAQATQKHIVHGSAPTDDTFLRESYRLVGWCGDYGMALAAPAMRVMTHEGELSLEQVVEASQQWWGTYWRMYWAKRSTDEALPHDYACEATIPLEDFSFASDDPN